MYGWPVWTIWGTKEDANMAFLLAECSWQSTSMCAVVCTSPHSQKRVSASPILYMCSFSLLFPLNTLIHVLCYYLQCCQNRIACFFVSFMKVKGHHSGMLGEWENVWLWKRATKIKLASLDVFMEGGVTNCLPPKAMPIVFISAAGYFFYQCDTQLSIKKKYCWKIMFVVGVDPDVSNYIWH